jgi:bisphosphoglycerate-independent phosphoglycerate mutase (AlkP superfamily)
MESEDRADLQKWALCDIAPTILGLLNIQIPAEMTGNSLIIE